MIGGHTGHEEHGDISRGSRRSRDGNYVSDDTEESRRGKVKETLAGAVGVPGVGQGHEDGPDPRGSSQEKSIGGVEAEGLSNGREEEDELG